MKHRRAASGIGGGVAASAAEHIAMAEAKKQRGFGSSGRSLGRYHLRAKSLIEVEAFVNP